MVTAEFWNDLHWGESHHTELLRTHRDEWVAILNKEVISSGINLAKVREDAQIKTGRNDIPVLFLDCGQHLYGQN